MHVSHFVSQPLLMLIGPRASAKHTRMAGIPYSRGIVESKHLEEMADLTVCATGIKVAYGDCEECHPTTHPTLRAATEEAVEVVQ